MSEAKVERCQKCFRQSGDDWRQCGGACPMPQSPHYQPPRRAGMSRMLIEAMLRKIIGASDSSAGSVPGRREGGG